MQSWIPEDPPSPQPDPSTPGCRSPDEVDIEVEETGEHVGDYETIEDYFRGLLEEFIHPDAHWLLACLDMTKVRQRFEGGGRYAYICTNGRVYRMAR